jgi:hypothetical protein
MITKKTLVEKIKGINSNYSDEQAIKIANFLMSISEVFYEIHSKSNIKNK